MVSLNSSSAGLLFQKSATCCMPLATTSTKACPALRAALMARSVRWQFAWIGTTTDHPQISCCKSRRRAYTPSCRPCIITVAPSTQYHTSLGIQSVTSKPAAVKARLYDEKIPEAVPFGKA